MIIRCACCMYCDMRYRGLFSVHRQQNRRHLRNRFSDLLGRGIREGQSNTRRARIRCIILSDGWDVETVARNANDLCGGRKRLEQLRRRLLQTGKRQPQKHSSGRTSILDESWGKMFGQSIHQHFALTLVVPLDLCTSTTAA